MTFLALINLNDMIIFSINNNVHCLSKRGCEMNMSILCHLAPMLYRIHMPAMTTFCHIWREIKGVQSTAIVLIPRVLNAMAFVIIQHICRVCWDVGLHPCIGQNSLH